MGRDWISKCENLERESSKGTIMVDSAKDLGVPKFARLIA